MVSSLGHMESAHLGGQGRGPQEASTTQVTLISQAGGYWSGSVQPTFFHGKHHMKKFPEIPTQAAPPQVSGDHTWPLSGLFSKHQCRGLRNSPLQYGKQAPFSVASQVQHSTPTACTGSHPSPSCRPMNLGQEARRISAST